MKVKILEIAKRDPELGEILLDMNDRIDNGEQKIEQSLRRIENTMRGQNRTIAGHSSEIGKMRDEVIKPLAEIAEFMQDLKTSFRFVSKIRRFCIRVFRWFFPFVLFCGAVVAAIRTGSISELIEVIRHTFIR